MIVFIYIGLILFSTMFFSWVGFIAGLVIAWGIHVLILLYRVLRKFNEISEKMTEVGPGRIVDSESPYQPDELANFVVDKEYDELKRGQMVSYRTPVVQFKREGASVPKMNIGRIIALPGETVEIKEGQVYIDGKMLEAPYGRATLNGYSEEEYFNIAGSQANWDDASISEYFKTSMERVTVKVDTVFVLVDEWSKGFDSRDFGLLPIGAIEGVIVGHEA